MRTKRVVFYCLAGLLAGCVPIVSLNPLFTKETIVFDETLLGTWFEDSNDPGESWTWEFTHFEESSAKSLPEVLQGQSKRLYRLNLTHKEGPGGSLVACLVKLEERRFLDIFPDRLPSGESDPEKMKLPLNALFLCPCHMLLRVDAIGDELKLGITLEERFKELVKADPNAVGYAMTERGLVLTASTKELQAFVTKYADDDRLFVSPMTLARKSK